MIEILNVKNNLIWMGITIVFRPVGPSSRSCHGLCGLNLKKSQYQTSDLKFELQHAKNQLNWMGTTTMIFQKNCLDKKHKVIFRVKFRELLQPM
jgi:hypothetical protein